MICHYNVKYYERLGYFLHRFRKVELATALSGQNEMQGCAGGSTRECSTDFTLECATPSSLQRVAVRPDSANIQPSSLLREDPLQKTRRENKTRSVVFEEGTFLF